MNNLAQQRVPGPQLFDTNLCQHNLKIEIEQIIWVLLDEQISCVIVAFINVIIIFLVQIHWNGKRVQLYCRHLNQLLLNVLPGSDPKILSEAFPKLESCIINCESVKIDPKQVHF